jgi:hypothetical protein
MGYELNFSLGKYNVCWEMHIWETGQAAAPQQAYVHGRRLEANTIVCMCVCVF